jgi:tight adherence protein B
MPILVALGAFVVVSLATFLLGSLLDQRNARARLLRERLASVDKAAGRQPSEELALLRDEMLSQIPALDNLLRRSERISKLRTLLEQAGLKMRAGNVLLLCLLSGAGLGLLVVVFSGFPQFVWLGIIFGAILPYSYANYRRSKRFQKFEEIFPEAVDTLARAVRAGHAFTTALELIANEIADPVASEFRKLFEEQKFGNLAEILDNLSYVIRERFKIMRQVRVHTAQGRLTMMLLMGLPPIIIVTMQIMNPSFIRPLFDDPIGHALLVVGMTLQTVGYFVIRRIIQIHV